MVLHAQKNSCEVVVDNEESKAVVVVRASVIGLFLRRRLLKFRGGVSYLSFRPCIQHVLDGRAAGDLDVEAVTTALSVVLSHKIVHFFMVMGLKLGKPS